METIKKQLTLPKDKYYIKHLSIVNVFLPIELTPKEIEVIAAFMSLEGDIALDRFGTSARRIVMDKLNVSPGGLGNYLKSLKRKGFIITQDGGALSILPLLNPEKGEQKYSFKLERA